MWQLGAAAAAGDRAKWLAPLRQEQQISELHGLIWNRHTASATN